MAKSALCVGINDYPGTGSDLSGCVNDANDWSAALKKKGFNVTQLLDKQATLAAMREALKKLVNDAAPGDTVVFTYSGHGTWVPDVSGDEPDRRDEALCPYDIGQNRPFLDDDLHTVFSERKPNVKVIFLSDSCHSGTVSKFAPFSGDGASQAKVRFLPPSTFLPAKQRDAVMKRIWFPVFARPKFPALLMSGCLDHEYSYDATFGGRPNGAFTYFALKSLGASGTYREWFRNVRESLPTPNYPQTPNMVGTTAQKNWTIFS